MKILLNIQERFNRANRYISRSILNSPARILITGFAVLILIGAILLVLPVSTSGPCLSFIDALFTATSASCVTGLAVVDTGTVLSSFGQTVILILIQVGGIGIMSFSTLFLMIAGKRPSLAGRIVIKDTFTHGGDQSPQSILRDVVLFTFLIEGIGASLVFLRVLPDNELPRALYLSVFHSISAFCNAGFSLFSDSLTAYREDWILNLVISFLIISGGIGFLIFSELKRNFPFKKRTWRHLSLHSKLVMSATFFLLVISTLAILLMEWDNTLAPLSFPGRFLAAFFQAVSARTAGFNTLSISEMANETLFFVIILMFIGACPGSCAGGIKLTTAMTLLLLGTSSLFGRERAQIFHRSIPEASVAKAISVVMISMMVVAFGTMLLLWSELGETPHPMSRGRFLEILFEMVSAFGTVGLSTGLTAGLTMTGKLIVTVMMFMGRLGPLTIVLAISRRKKARYYYAEENIMVG